MIYYLIEKFYKGLENKTLEKAITSTQTDYRNSVIEGMDGLLELELKTDDLNKTFFKNLKTKPPILVQKAMYLDANNPKKAHIILMSSAGGMLQGDTIDIKITAGKNTQSHITTQSATKIFKSENKKSTQNVELILEDESYMEFLPQHIIPHKSSQFSQHVNIKMKKNATLVYCETISAGRITHGEQFDFDSIKLRLNCSNFEDEVLFSEAMNLNPNHQQEKFHSLFGNKTQYCTIFIISHSQKIENLASKINERFKEKDMTGFSILPNNSGIVIKSLSNSIDEINNLISTVKFLAREQLETVF